jgi:hypothetical protein
MFAQYLGGAVFLCVARAVLSSGLLREVEAYAPSVDPQLIIGTGITEIGAVVPPELLSSVMLAYNRALVDVWVSLTYSHSLMVMRCKGAVDPLNLT